MRETFKLNFNQVENEAGSSSSLCSTSFAAIALWAILNNNKIKCQYRGFNIKELLFRPKILALLHPQSVTFAIVSSCFEIKKQ